MPHTFKGPWYPIVQEDGSTVLASSPNSPGLVEIGRDFSLISLDDVSRDIIEKFDLNSKDELLFRSNAQNISDARSPSIPDELKRVIGRFRNSINEVVGLNRYSSALRLSLTGSPSPREETLNRLVYANIITVLETFLSDYLITSVKINEDVFKNLVNKHEKLCQKKFTLKELIVKDLLPFDIIIQTLEKETFHNIKVVTAYYNAAFDIDIEPSIAIISAVDLRHDIIHRSGKQVGEEHPVRIHPREIHQLILDAQTFIISLLNKLSKQ